MSGRASPEPPPPGRVPAHVDRSPRRAAVVAVALAGALAIGLVAVSSSGPVRILSEPPPERVEVIPPEDLVEVEEAADPGEGVAPVEEEGDGWFLRIVALALGVLLLRLAWMTIAGWWAILRTWRPGRRRRVRQEAFDALPSVAVPVVVLDEESQIAALRTGEPRNAIVACWVRLEDDVAAAGMAPRPSETSAELTARVLDAALADRSAVEELADRYREARFSDHPVGEHERELALAALARIHASLRRHAVAAHGDAP